MLLLTSTSDLVRVVTSASSDVRVHASFVDLASGTITPTRTNTASIATNTTTTVVASPAGSTQRNVKHLNIRNVHASTSNDVTVFHTDGTTQEDLIKVTLLAGESLVFDQVGGWTHYDVNGAPYLSPGPVASQAEMEAGTSTTVFVTPGRQHLHPSAAKFWVKWTANSTTILASYNVTSIADTATGQATVTIATDFSSANYAACVTVEATGTTWAVANAREPHLRSATLAAGTLVVDCIDNTATTNLEKDPSTWHVIAFGDQ